MSSPRSHSVKRAVSPDSAESHGHAQAPRLESSSSTGDVARATGVMFIQHVCRDSQELSEHDRAELIQMYDAGVPWEVMLVSYHQKRGSKEFHTPIKSLDNRRRSMKPSWLSGMSPRERGW